jgi:hypothetical protein
VPFPTTSIAANAVQKWRNQPPQRRATQEKCGAAEPQRLSLPAAHDPARQPGTAAYQAGSGLSLCN